MAAGPEGCFREMKPSSRTILRLTLLAAGVGAFAWYLGRAGLREVMEAFRKLGSFAPVVLIPYFLVYIVDAVGWRLTFPGAMPVRFPGFWRIRWIGEAVNNVIPSAYIGGEALKVYLLKQRGVDATTATTAAVVSKSAQTLAQLLFICTAAALFLRIAPEAPGLRQGIAVVLGGGLAAVGVLFWIQSRGVFGSVRRVTGCFGWKPQWLEARREGLERTDRTITGFYRDHRGRFLASTLAYLAGWLLDSTEIYLVSRLVGQPVTVAQALVVEAFVGVAKVMGMWVPGAMGVQEGGILLIGRTAALPEPLCLAYAVLRRAREVVFVAVGWLLLYASSSRPNRR
jgi:uncharacterized protein (TIRG00374 family)